MNIKEIFNSRKKELDKRITENEILKKQIDSAQEEMLDFAEKLEIGQEGIQFLEDIASARRGSMKDEIEKVVSEGLRIIYGNNYRVELNYEIKRNRSDLTIELVKSTPVGEIRRTMEGFGGGVSDTISVPLRLLILLGSQQTERICCLDEAYKHADDRRIDSIAEFLQDMSKKLKMQIIMTSHHDVMRTKADSVYWVDYDKSTAKSLVKKVA